MSDDYFWVEKYRSYGSEFTSTENLRNAVRYLVKKVKGFKAIESRRDAFPQILQTDLLPLHRFQQEVFLHCGAELDSALFAAFFRVEGPGIRRVNLDTNQFHMHSIWFDNTKVAFSVDCNKNSERTQGQGFLTNFISRHLSDLVDVETLPDDIKLTASSSDFLFKTHSARYEDNSDRRWVSGVFIRCDHHPRWPERVQVMMHKYLRMVPPGHLVHLAFEGDFDAYSQLQQAHAGASRRWNYCIDKEGWWDTEAKHFGSPNGISRLPVASMKGLDPPCLQIDLVIGKDGKKIIDVQSPWPEAKVLELTKAAGLDVKPWPGAFCDRWLE